MSPTTCYNRILYYNYIGLIYWDHSIKEKTLLLIILKLHITCHFLSFGNLLPVFSHLAIQVFPGPCIPPAGATRRWSGLAPWDPVLSLSLSYHPGRGRRLELNPAPLNQQSVPLGQQTRTEWQNLWWHSSGNRWWHILFLLLQSIRNYEAASNYYWLWDQWM